MIKLSQEIKYAELYYTLRCTFKCPYCINEIDNVLRKREEKDYKELAQAINNIDFGDLILTIGGGEPTMRKDFYQFMHEIRDDINLDLLTNLSFNVDEFIKELSPERFTNKKDTAYKSIRISYHPSQMDLEDTVEKAKRLEIHGFPVGVFGIAYPESISTNIKMAELARKYGLFFFVKEYLGEFKDRFLGYYRYRDAVRGPNKDVLCKTSELLIDSSGKRYKCHRDLYDNAREIGNIFSDIETIEVKYRKCSLYGSCNPCDIKTKISADLENNRCSVEIKSI